MTQDTLTGNVTAVWLKHKEGMEMLLLLADVNTQELVLQEFDPKIIWVNFRNGLIYVRGVIILPMKCQTLTKTHSFLEPTLTCSDGLCPTHKKIFTLDIHIRKGKSSQSSHVESSIRIYLAFLQFRQFRNFMRCYVLRRYKRITRGGSTSWLHDPPHS